MSERRCYDNHPIVGPLGRSLRSGSVARLTVHRSDPVPQIADGVGVKRNGKHFH